MFFSDFSQCEFCYLYHTDHIKKPNQSIKLSTIEGGLNLLHKIFSGQAGTFMVDKTQIYYEKW